jgi:hypothetical protein
MNCFFIAKNPHKKVPAIDNAAVGHAEKLAGSRDPYPK